MTALNVGQAAFLAGLSIWNLFCQDAKFWHAVWVSSGKPNTGDLNVAIARSRNLYHYAVRKARRQVDLFKAKKLLEASLTSDMELLKEMKKIRS